MYQKALEIKNQHLKPLCKRDSFVSTPQVDTSDEMQPATIRDLISETVRMVKQTVGEVKANGNQSKRLGERIDAIVSVLKPMNDADLQQSGLRKPLVDCAICTEQCLAFLKKFQDETVWFSEVFNNQTFKEQFKKLNDQLLQCAKDLHLDNNIAWIFNEKHDQEDQDKDMKDIQSKEDQISGMMINQEQDQLRHLQGITEHQSRRYNSYKYHLKQSITQGHHSINLEDRPMINILFFKFHITISFKRNALVVEDSRMFIVVDGFHKIMMLQLKSFEFNT